MPLFLPDNFTANFIVYLCYFLHIIHNFIVNLHTIFVLKLLDLLDSVEQGI